MGAHLFFVVAIALAVVTIAVVAIFKWPDPHHETMLELWSLSLRDESGAQPQTPPLLRRAG